MKLLLSICMLFLCGCTKELEYHEITTNQAKDMMQEDVVILDVRDKEEYDSGHIENALNIPVENIKDVEDEVVDKNKTILVYCLSGKRSAKASKQLVDLGYINVYDFGGIQDWPYDVK